MTSVNDEYISIEDHDGLEDMGEIIFDQDYMIVLTEEELQDLGDALDLMVDALSQLGEAVPPIVEQITQMAKDVQ